MIAESLRAKLLEFIMPSYPDIDIQVVDTADNVIYIYFTDQKFACLYPTQRYHYLIHLIPNDFFDLELQNTVWYELAPGENPEDLDYHDEETINEIKGVILDILEKRTTFVEQLDELFLSKHATCHGDFRHSKTILSQLNFTEEEQFDIFHVLMNEGGYCDCEILYNSFKNSGYAKQYWLNRDK